MQDTNVLTRRSHITFFRIFRIHCLTLFVLLIEKYGQLDMMYSTALHEDFGLGNITIITECNDGYVILGTVEVLKMTSLIPCIDQGL